LSLDVVSSSQEERSSHQSTHGDSARVGLANAAVVNLVIEVKGLVAVSVLLNRHELVTSDLVVVSSSDAHSVSVNGNISTTSVSGLSPGEDSITELSGDGESRRVRTGDHVNGSQGRLRSTSTASSHSEVVSSSSNVERELVSNSILA
jgi:hypothetical protein